MAESVLLDVADRVATVTLNRPEAMNALDPETIAALHEVWVEIRDNPDVWVAIVTGTGGKAFCAGADLKKTIPNRPGAEGQENWRTFQPNAAPASTAESNSGLTLLSACDIRVASQDATFGLPEVKRGILPTLGATQRLIRQLPFAVAMEVLLVGDPLNAEDALKYGLVNKVVAKADVMSTAREYAAKFLSGPPLTQRAIKEAAIRSRNMPLDEGMRLEELLSNLVRRTEDFKEGPKAFAEKRPPVYKGN